MRKSKSMSLRPRSLATLPDAQVQAAAEKTFYFWVNYYVHEYIPLRFNVEPPKFVTTVRDVDTCHEAALDWVSHLARRYLAEKSAIAPKASGGFGFKSRVTVGSAQRRYLEMLIDCFGISFGLERHRPEVASPEALQQLGVAADNPEQSEVLLGMPVQFLMVRQALEAGEAEGAERLAEEIDTQGLHSTRALGAMGFKHYPLAESLTKFRENARANPDGVPVDYVVALRAFHNAFRQDFSKMEKIGLAKHKIEEIERAYKTMQGHYRELDVRGNAKKPRRGTRPQVEERRVMREEMLDLFDEQLHDDRFDELYALFDRLQFDQRTHRDMLQTLAALDLSQLTEQEFSALKRTYSDFAANFDTSTAASRQAVPSFRRLSSLGRQERLLDPYTQATFQAAGVSRGKRMQRLPAADANKSAASVFFERAKPEDGSFPLLEELIKDLGEEGAGRLLWYMSRDAKGKPFALELFPEHFSAYHLIGFNYPEYVKMYNKHGIENANIYNLQAIRLFGTLEEFEKYLDAVDEKWRHMPKEDLSSWLHNTVGLASLTLPRYWTKGRGGRVETWDRAGWVEFVYKYKHEGMNYIANAPLYQSIFRGKVPDDLGMLKRRLVTDDPARAITQFPKIPVDKYPAYEKMFRYLANDADPKYFKDEEVFSKLVVYSLPWNINNPWGTRIPYLPTQVADADKRKMEKREYTLKQSPHKSPLNTFFGALPQIDDCMFIGGFSTNFVYAACEDPNRGFLYIEEITPEGGTQVRAAAGWYMSPNKKKLCFDSIEIDSEAADPGQEQNDWYYTIVNYLFAEASVYLVEKYGFETVTIGTDVNARIKFSVATKVWDKDIPEENPLKFGGKDFDKFKPRNASASEFLAPRTDLYTDARDKQYTYLPVDFAKKRAEARANRSRRSRTLRRPNTRY